MKLLILQSSPFPCLGPLLGQNIFHSTVHSQHRTFTAPYIHSTVHSQDRTFERSQPNFLSNVKEEL